MSLKKSYLAIALLGSFSLAACSNTAAGVEKDAAQNADKAAAATADAREGAANAARDASTATKEAAANAGGAIAAAIETIDVKSALMADRTVDSSHINVDTIHDTKTVLLKGSVPTSTQRDEAARIAAVEAPGYRVDNQLTVVPNP